MKYFEDFENNLFEQIRLFYEKEPTYGWSGFKNGWYDIVLEYGFSGDEPNLIDNYNADRLARIINGFFNNLSSLERNNFALLYKDWFEGISKEQTNKLLTYDEELVLKFIEQRFKEWVAYYFSLQALFEGVYEEEEEDYDYDSIINLPNEYSSLEAILFNKVKKEFLKLPPLASDDYDSGWDDLVSQYGSGGEEYLLITNEYENVLIQFFEDEFNALNQEDKDILKNDYSNNNEKSNSIPDEIIISEIVGRFKLWIEDNFNVDDLYQDEEDEDGDEEDEDEDEDEDDLEDFEEDTEINKFDNNTISFEEYGDNPNQLKLFESKQIILFIGGISMGDEYKVKGLVYEIGFTDDVLIKTRNAMPTRNLYAGFFEFKGSEDWMYNLKEKLYQTFEANDIGMVDFFMIDATVSTMYKSIWHDGFY